MATLTNLALLQKFAPVMYLHPDETNLPCSADWYLTQCKLTDQNGNVMPLTQNGITNSDDLVDMPRPRHRAPPSVAKHAPWPWVQARVRSRRAPSDVRA